MFEIRVAGSFKAGHAIRYPNGDCEESHEHQWKVEARFSGANLDECGLLIDFVEAQRDLNAILDVFDGTDLNANPVLDGRNPTAEVVAEVIFNRLGCGTDYADKCIGVLVEESPGCKACYRPLRA